MAVRLLLNRDPQDAPQAVHPFNIWTSDLDILAEIKPDGKVCPLLTRRVWITLIIGGQNENVISVTVADAKVEASSVSGNAMTVLELNAPFRNVSGDIDVQLGKPLPNSSFQGYHSSPSIRDPYQVHNRPRNSGQAVPN